MGSRQRVYLSTYTHHNGERRANGIFQYEFDGESGALELRRPEATLPDPSFLAASPDGRFLYATNELGDFQGTKGGAVSAYAIEPGSGALTFLNVQPSGGAHPCYISLDPTGKWAFVANYSGGSVAVYPIGRDGRLGQMVSFVQHTGSSGADPNRQEAPHTHSILLDPSGRYALVADLGKDQVVVYKFDSLLGRLTLNSPSALHLAPGSGPRHMGFLPGGSYFYVVNELTSTVSAYRFHSETGTFSELQTISALEGATGAENAADLHIAPSGRFLYTSNRGYSSGHDSISVFSIDGGTGQLERVEIVPSGGKTPRNFSFDLTGNYLLVANQQSSSVVVFRVDANTGRLTPTGQVAEVPMPVCVCFVP